jgi:D-alanyl-D-alanine dipeptidase
MKKTICVMLLLVFIGAPAYAKAPTNFVDVHEVIPSAVINMRYFGTDNFVGARVDGYKAPVCLLTKDAAAALKAVADEIAPFGLKLHIYDCYRPQKAVDHFARWAADIGDVKTKKKYYPDVDKRNLFKDGYIAEKSGHSRGSTVDLTIDGLDMGKYFDFFGDISATAYANIPQAERDNRLLIKAVMEVHGFVNYAKEWWHYTLKDEPYKKKYFNFDVQ